MVLLLENLELELISFQVPKKNRDASHLVTSLNHSNGFRRCNLSGYDLTRPETVCPCRADTPRLVLWVASPCPQLDTSERERIDGSKPRTKGIRSAVPHKTVITPQRSRRCHRPYVVLRYNTLNLPHRTASVRGVQGHLLYDGQGRAKSHKEGALGEPLARRVDEGESLPLARWVRVGFALGWMAAGLEQSVPLTGGGRELGRKATGRATGLLCGLDDFL